METRLIIAYLLILLMLAALVWVGFYFSGKRREHRDLMRGRYRH